MVIYSRGYTVYYIVMLRIRMFFSLIPVANPIPSLTQTFVVVGVLNLTDCLGDRLNMQSVYPCCHKSMHASMHAFHCDAFIIMHSPNNQPLIFVTSLQSLSLLSHNGGQIGWKSSWSFSCCHRQVLTYTLSIKDNTT